MRKIERGIFLAENIATVWASPLWVAFLPCQDIRLVFVPRKPQAKVFALDRILDVGVWGKLQPVGEGYRSHGVGSVGSLNLYDLGHRIGNGCTNTYLGWATAYYARVRTDELYGYIE